MDSKFKASILLRALMSGIAIEYQFNKDTKYNVRMVDSRLFIVGESYKVEKDGSETEPVEKLLPFSMRLCDLISWADSFTEQELGIISTDAVTQEVKDLNEKKQKERG